MTTWVVRVLTFGLLMAAGRNTDPRVPETIFRFRFDEGSGKQSADAIRGIRGHATDGATWTAGKFDRAIRFDGKTGKFAVATNATVRIPPDAGLTLEAWVRLAPGGLIGTQQVFHGLCGKGQTRLNLEIRRPGNVWFALGAKVVQNTRFIVADGVWRHIAGVWDPRRGRMIVYVDGREDGSVPFEVKHDLVLPIRFVVGGEVPGTITARREECLEGAVDELRLSRGVRQIKPNDVPPAERIEPPRVAEPKPTPRPRPRTAPLPPLADLAVKQKQFTNSIGMKFVLIPPGDFPMGGRDFNNQPVHRVRITRPFYMGAYEVTQGQFKRVMGYNPSFFSYDAADRPVDCVSWFEAVEFCRRLSKKQGRAYRLPTEAEWEYAGRAGTTTTYYFGDDPAKLPEYCWGRGKHVNNTDRAMPVGTRKPNGWGLYDMLGNVSEWCLDWYDPLAYPDHPVADPIGPKRSYIVQGIGAKVHRGGNIRGGMGRVPRPRYTCAYRDYGAPDVKSLKVGFRVVCEVK